MENNDIEVFSLIRNNSLYSSISSSLNTFINTSFDVICKEMINMSQIASEVQEYINEQCQAFIKIYTSSSSSSSGETLSYYQYELILEAFESLITKALYPKLITLLGTDAKFDRLIRKYSFMTEHYLNLPVKFDSFELHKQLLLFGEHLIETMNPKGKLIALKNLSNYVNSYINDTDLLWKGLLFVILKIPMMNMKSYIRYCLLFRNKVLLTTEEDILLMNVTKAFDLIEKLSLNNISEINMQMDKFKEFSDEFEKKDLVSSLTLSKGHFTYNKFLDDRLLVLLNSGKDIWNHIYENKSHIKDEGKESKNMIELISLNTQTIEQLIKFYYHIEVKETKMSELNHIRQVFKSLITLIFKEQPQY